MRLYGTYYSQHNEHTFTSNFLLNNLHTIVATPLGRQLRVLNIESPISGQIPYPDERRSRHGRIREVELYLELGYFAHSLISGLNDDAAT